MSRENFPFAAIVGQEKLKTAYLLNIINPSIGGLLISGPKGTGKSTIVYSVLDILPQYKAIKDCKFNCSSEKTKKLCSFCKEKESIEVSTKTMRIVNLPLSASEDRVIGTINIEKLLKEGKKEIEVGILGEANQNILYIDEVNLLPNHIVDNILDASASNWNSIEREGFSIQHPSEFILIGTMNPEEGELRPQILDRFPLCVKIENITEESDRVEVIKRNHIFETDSEKLFENFKKESNALKSLIIEARKNLQKVKIEDKYLYAIAGACIELKIDGNRADMVISKTAKTLAVLDKRFNVEAKDILLAAELTLNHRTRDGGLLEPPKIDEIQKIFQERITSQKSIKRFNNIEDLENNAANNSGNFLEIAPSEEEIYSEKKSVSFWSKIRKRT